MELVSYLYKGNKIMDDDTILVSMGVFNRESVVLDAIKSVIGQTYKNVVLHIIDDCSTDGSVDIIMGFLNKTQCDNIIFGVSNNNLGVYKQRNNVFKYHENDLFGYFTNHDSDDTSNLERFDNLIKLIIMTGNDASESLGKRDETLKYFEGVTLIISCANHRI